MFMNIGRCSSDIHEHHCMVADVHEYHAYKKSWSSAAQGPYDIHERRGDIHERMVIIHEHHMMFMNIPVHEYQTSDIPR